MKLKTSSYINEKVGNKISHTFWTKRPPKPNEKVR